MNKKPEFFVVKGLKKHIIEMKKANVSAVNTNYMCIPEEIIL